MPKAIFFDVDGVLLNSLPAHLEFCRMANMKFDAGATIPKCPDDFKEEIVRRRKMTISPMVEFFKAVGFVHAKATRADELYEKNFSNETIHTFKNISELIAKLRIKKVKLGIVTSNTCQNITRHLGDLRKEFNPVFTKDTGLNKTAALKIGAEILKIQPREILYIGDQPNDKVAADNAGVEFLGVTYGWGFSKEDNAPPALVHEPMEVYRHIFPLG